MFSGRLSAATSSNCSTRPGRPRNHFVHHINPPSGIGYQVAIRSLTDCARSGSDVDDVPFRCICESYRGLAFAPASLHRPKYDFFGQIIENASTLADALIIVDIINWWLHLYLAPLPAFSANCSPAVLLEDLGLRREAAGSLGFAEMSLELDG